MASGRHKVDVNNQHLGLKNCTVCLEVPDDEYFICSREECPTTLCGNCKPTRRHVHRMVKMGGLSGHPYASPGASCQVCSSNMDTSGSSSSPFTHGRKDGPFEGLIQGKVGGKAMARGNLCLRFHGTTRTCKLGCGNQVEPCKDKSCAVCNIIRTSFRLPVDKTKFERFGFGIYFTSTSSKSDDYNSKSTQTVNGITTKCMFVAKVLIGKGQRLTQDEVHRTAPDPGYHSVLGEVGGSLNYDECVVYDVASAIPGYLVVYQV